MTRLQFLTSIGFIFVMGCSDALPPSHDDDGGVQTSRLPCEIEHTIANYCRRCHQAPLLHVPIELTSHADLTRMSYEDPTATYAERAVIRMRSSTLPMPPSGARPTEAEIAAFEAWVVAGAPEGECEP